VTTRAWLDDATKVMLRIIDGLDDGDFTSPSALPGWTVAHVVAHLHFNAEGIGRLTTWARTGIETPMYASAAQRNDDINAGSLLGPGELRHLVHASSRALNDSFDALTPPMWRNTVVTAQGRTVPATELLWMRFREVAVHTIDIGRDGIGFADFPNEAVAKLTNEIVAKRLASGEANALAAWLTGRTKAGPALGPWL
jgi:uncharacterized protein (TIGR03083 family)